MLLLGIDIGSVTAKLALLDGERVIDARVLRTQGRPAEALRRLLAEALARHGDLEVTVVATGSGKSLVPDPAGRVSEIVAHARSAARFHPHVRTVLEIGGQDAKMIWLPGTGEPRILDHALNDLCAAGTGAFLDQQAARLGLDAAELGRLAASSTAPATVAGRCAVFAKTDMIHLQQRGVPAADICAGVCHALVRNVVATLARGREVPAPLLLQGGVALSAGVRAAVPAVLDLPPERVELPERPVAMGAVGAALLAGRRGGRATLSRLLAGVPDEAPLQESPAPRLAPPPPAPAPRPRTRRARGPFRLGIDIGSASTKAVLLDGDGRVAASAYLPTRGRPLRAAREVLEALHRQHPTAEVTGLCATGSGRHLVALWLGADATIDEITAQARGARVAFGDDLTGVIEIGGQDAKAIALSGGRVARFAMNRLCAAGTGSFLEEQAARLDTPIEAFAEQAFASTAPARLAGKCAVFMDADLVHHQQHGASRADLLAGLAHAVVENYLRRVRGPVDLGDRPVFQGGVAANTAVVAAFRQALDRPVRVHPHAAVSGALGAALSAPDNAARRSLAELAAAPEPPARATTCKLCDNRCELTVLRADDDRPVTLGGACGRHDRARLVPGARAREDAAAELLAERERLWTGPPRDPEAPAPRGRIGVPRGILAHDLYPFLRTFLEALGWEPVPSGPSRRTTLLRAAHALTAEPCLPAKLLLGHAGELADAGIPAVFLPTLLSVPEADPDVAPREPSRVGRRYPCMYGLTAGDLACAASLVDEPDHHRGRADATPSKLERAVRRLLGDRPLPDRPTSLRRRGGGPRLVAPELILDPRSSLFRGLLAEFARRERLDPDAAVAAARRGLDAYLAYRRELRALGRRFLERHSDATVAVLLGHPYVVHDPYLNLQLARRLARAGFLPLPFDLVPDAPPLGPSWACIGWRSNRDLLRAAAWTAARDDAFPVVLTCFGCGPDAFVVRFLEEALGARPHLTLEFDEHQAEAGLETRIEAFRHAVDEPWRRARPAATTSPRKTVDDGAAPGPVAPPPRPHAGPLERWAPWTTGRREDVRNRTIVVSRFSDAAAVFRGFLEAMGLDARLGPEIDESSLALGREFSGGQECNPFAYFTGDLVRALQQPGADPARLAFYVPASEGACLLGQYGRGFESAARRLGAENLVIYNPHFGELTSGAGVPLLAAFWQGLAALEALIQLAADLRPFELEPGATDRARRQAADLIGDGVARHRVRPAVERAVELLAAAPRRPPEPRPAVGLVGDVFTRANDAANRYLVRTIEQAGCRVLVPPTITDIAAYVPGEWVHDGRRSGDHRFVLRSALLETWQRFSGLWTIMPLRRLGPLPRLERTYREAVALARPYLGRPVEAMLALNVSKAVEQLEAGALGVLSVVCHGCMVGVLSESAFRPLREAYPGRPVLTLTYDGLGDTHVATRVEAFLQRVLDQREVPR
ncbi:MAG: hypothetical protein GYA57_03595 [Myxococcales bacterium]|nr:hypothetical protein [Myxococcales bacterium]